MLSLLYFQNYLYGQDGGFMLETRFIASKCDKCQQDNNVSLNYFVGLNYKFEKSVVAMCQACNKDFIVMFDESMVL
jgi:hypothetical protein